MAVKYDSKIGKSCSKCECYRPLRDFPVDKRGSGGRGSWCLECQRLYRKSRYASKSATIARQARQLAKVLTSESPDTVSAGGAIIANCLSAGSPLSEQALVIGCPASVLRDVLTGVTDLSVAGHDAARRASLWLSLSWWRTCYRMGSDGSADLSELAMVTAAARSLERVSAGWLHDYCDACAECELDPSLDGLVVVDAKGMELPEPEGGEGE